MKNLAKNILNIILVITILLNCTQKLIPSEATELSEAAEMIKAGKSVKRFGGLKSFALMTAFYIGQGYTTALFGQEEAEEQKKIFEKLEILRKKIEEENKKLREKSQEKIKIITKNFMSKLKESSKTPEFISSKANQKIRHIIKLQEFGISPGKILPQKDPENAILFDKIFKKSKLLTPEGPSWHQFYTNTGNWTYSSSLNAFVQRESLIGNSWYLIKQDLKEEISDKKADLAELAEQNSIFTELYTNEKKYTIQVELTILSYVYPFFIGIIFNKARWISGNLDRMKTHRLLGIYGKNADNTKLYVTETENPFDVIKLKSPFEQIFSETAQPIFNFENLKKRKKSTKLLVTLNIQKNQVTVSIGEEQVMPNKKNKQYSNILKEKIVKFENPETNNLIFLYHGIGFSTAGNQSIFKLKRQEKNAPVNAIIYTSDKIARFNQSPQENKKPGENT